MVCLGCLCSYQAHHEAFAHIRFYETSLIATTSFHVVSNNVILFSSFDVILTVLQSIGIYANGVQLFKFMMAVVVCRNNAFTDALDLLRVKMEKRLLLMGLSICQVLNAPGIPRVNIHSDATQSKHPYCFA